MAKNERDPKYDTEEWKIKMAEHVDHECDCFYKYVQLAIEIATGGIQVEKEWASAASGAAVDAWLIHVRSLLCFFYAHPSVKHPDMVARHYLNDAAWAEHKGFLVPDDAIRKRIQDIGAFVAHINARRAESNATDLTQWGKHEYEWVNDRLRRWHRLLDPDWQKRFPKLERWVTNSAP